MEHDEEIQERRNEARPGLSFLSTLKETTLDYGRRGEAKYGRLGRYLGLGAGAIVGLGKLVKKAADELFWAAKVTQT